MQPPAMRRSLVHVQFSILSHHGALLCYTFPLCVAALRFAAQLSGLPSFEPAQCGLPLLDTRSYAQMVIHGCKGDAPRACLRRVAPFVRECTRLAVSYSTLASALARSAY